MKLIHDIALGISSVLISVSSLLAPHAFSGTDNGLWYLTGGTTLRPNVGTWSLQLPSLTSQNCIGTDVNGTFQAGSCGGGGGTFPFTTTSNFGQTANATTTAVWFQGSPISLMASSSARFGSTGNLTINSDGTLNAGGTVGTATSTFATGISVGTGFAPYPEYTFNSDTNTGLDSSGPDILNIVTAGSNRITLNAAGAVGVASTTPFGFFAINPTAGVSSNEFVIGSSTRTDVIVSNNGSVGIASSTPKATFSLGSNTASTSALVAPYEYGRNGHEATSTAKTFGPDTRPSVVWPMGAAATTLTLCNFYPGQHFVVRIINPNETAGALTWATCAGSQLYWPNGTAPTQTTAANNWDIYSFDAWETFTGASSTPGIIMISGAQTPAFH